MIRAILRAQWLSMRSFRLASSRRGAVVSIITALLWYGFWTFIAAIAEELMAQRGLQAQITAWLPLGLLGVFAYWQLAPFASASLGASLDLRKLLIYPVPRQSLFLIEVLLRVTTCAEMLLVLAGASVGLLRNPAFGAWRGLPRVAGAMALFVAFNLLLAAGLRSLIDRLLARRRIREIVVLIVVLASVLPRLLIVTGIGRRRLEGFLPAARQAVWPWMAAARWLLDSQVLQSAAVLALWLALVYFFSRWQFARSLRFDAQAAQASVGVEKPAGFTDRWYRLPSLLLPDPLGALVEKELRSLARTPRFRLVFIMGFSFGVIVWLPTTLQGHGAHSSVSDNFLAVVSLYALILLGQVSFWNSFGFDRSATQIYFSAPVPISRALLSKNLAAGLFIVLEIGLVSAACSLLPLGISAGKIAEAFLVTGVSALYLMGLGNLSSVYYPRAMNPQRASAGGARGRAQGLMVLLYPVTLLPVLLAYLARYAFSSQVAFDLVLALAAVLGAAVYAMAMESAVSAARQRREIIVAELSRGEGPIAGE